MSATVSRTALVTGIVIAILASSGIAMVVSSQLSFGPKGDKGDTGPQGIQGEQGPQGEQRLPGLYVPDYDSGWIDITDKNGQYFNITHNLDSADVIVDITGKTTLDGGVHQRYFGPDYIPSWTKAYVTVAAAIRELIPLSGWEVYPAFTNATYTLTPSESSLFLELNATDTSSRVTIRRLNVPQLNLTRYDYVDVTVVGTGNAKILLRFFLNDGSSFDVVFWKSPATLNAAKFYLSPYAGRTLRGDVYIGLMSSDGTTANITITEIAFARAGPPIRGASVQNASAYSVVQTEDGGYAFAGSYYTGASPYDDFWLVKTDQFGYMQWNKTYGTTTGGERANSLIQTSDGGFAMAGYTNVAGPMDFWLVKTDQNGNMQWNKTYGGDGIDEARSIIQTADGGYAVAGYTWSYGLLGDFWLVKTDSAGTALWNRTYGGAGDERAEALVQTLDGGYAIAGTYRYGSSDSDFWLVRTDSVGNMLWNEQYDASLEDLAYSMVQTSDGGFALAGHTYVGTSGDAWLVKTYANGTMQWNHKYGYAEGYEEARSLVQTTDGGYLMAGSTSSYGSNDFWLLKTDAEGTTQWDRPFGEHKRQEQGFSMVVAADGGYVIAGWMEKGSGRYYAWLVKTEVESGIAWTDNTANTITLYRGTTDVYWNYVRVRIWKPKTP